jgi:hypothetical protein
VPLPRALPVAPPPLPLCAPLAEGDPDAEAQGVTLSDAGADAEPLGEALPDALPLALADARASGDAAAAALPLPAALRVDKSPPVPLAAMLGGGVQLPLALAPREGAPERVPPSRGLPLGDRVANGDAVSWPSEEGGMNINSRIKRCGMRILSCRRNYRGFSAKMVERDMGAWGVSAFLDLDSEAIFFFFPAVGIMCSPSLANGEANRH